MEIFFKFTRKHVTENRATTSYLKATDQLVLFGSMLKVCRGLKVEMRSGISADLCLNTHGRANAKRISNCAWHCCSDWRGQSDRRSWTWKRGARGPRWVSEWVSGCSAAVAALRTVRRAYLLSSALLRDSPHLSFTWRVGPYNFFMLKGNLSLPLCLLRILWKIPTDALGRNRRDTKLNLISIVWPCCLVFCGSLLPCVLWFIILVFEWITI